MTGILEGLKVIDCGSFIAGAAAGTVLADFGAESSRSSRQAPAMPIGM